MNNTLFIITQLIYLSPFFYFKSKIKGLRSSLIVVGIILFQEPVLVNSIGAYFLSPVSFAAPENYYNLLFLLIISLINLLIFIIFISYSKRKLNKNFDSNISYTISKSTVRFFLIATVISWLILFYYSENWLYYPRSAYQSDRRGIGFIWSFYMTFSGLTVLFLYLRKKSLLFPVILIGSVYVNNYIQYETSFYSTSSSFHMQWFNTASNNICKNYDFNELEVSEPGYVFENWLLENNLSKQSDSKILINKLKLDSKIGFFKNVHCKLLSISRSTVWNMFGIRGSNWESISDNNYVYLSIRLFSLIYVSLINFSLLRMVLSKNKSDFLLSLLLITVGYIVVSSILPFGNSRTRVLIEPFLVIIFVSSL